LRSLGGQELSVADGIVLQHGDFLRIVRAEQTVQKVAAKLGAIVAPDTSIDFVEKAVVFA
jgi:uncharacterized transporter YbjL